MSLNQLRDINVVAISIARRCSLITKTKTEGKTVNLFPMPQNYSHTNEINKKQEIKQRIDGWKRGEKEVPEKWTPLTQPSKVEDEEEDEN